MRMMTGLLLAAMLAASVVLPASARDVTPPAVDVQAVAGMSITQRHYWTRVAFVNVAFNRFWNIEGDGYRLRPVSTLGWVDNRSTDHAHLDNTVFVGGAGMRIDRFWHGMFASFQLGLAAGRTGALSSAGQFISSLGWQAGHFVFMLRHISNGRFFGGRNLGETMAMVGVHF